MASQVLGVLDPPASRYAGATVAALCQVLGPAVVGIYLYGSGVIGEFFPGRSDVDLVAVVDRALDISEARKAAEAVSALPRPYPTKGLDLTVVTLGSASTPVVSPAFELKLLTFFGEAMLGAGTPMGDPRLLMHFACCHDHGMALVGPAPRHVFAPVNRESFVGALRLEPDFVWMKHHYRVLNACRDWRFVEEGTICSKIDGGRWALPRVDDPWLVEAALRWQMEGMGPVMDGLLVDEFISGIISKMLGERR